MQRALFPGLVSGIHSFFRYESFECITKASPGVVPVISRVTLINMAFEIMCTIVADIEVFVNMGC